MKYLPLVWAALRRRPIRSVLTLLSVMVAFVLFGVMHGVVAGFDSALDKMSETRLRVMSRANILEPLPLAHKNRIERIDGVLAVAYVSILIGHYQDPKNGMTGAGVSMEEFLTVFPEIKMPADQRATLLAARTGAVVGSELAQRHGWKLGDRVTMISPMWTRVDGTSSWDFDIAAIANGEPGDEPQFANEIYFHFDYLDQARLDGRGTVHQFVVSIDDIARANATIGAIDAEFANSSDETTTLNEKEYLRSMVRQVGNVSYLVYAILGAVMFTLMFLTGNTMVQSVRERTSELAVLKTIGFSEFSLLALVVAESLCLCLTGAVAGLLIAAVAFPSVFASFGISGINLSSDVYVHGIGLATALALVVACLPSWQTRRLSVAAALARG